MAVGDAGEENDDNDADDDDGPNERFACISCFSCRFCFGLFCRRNIVKFSKLNEKYFFFFEAKSNQKPGPCQHKHTFFFLQEYPVMTLQMAYQLGGGR